MAANAIMDIAGVINFNSTNNDRNYEELYVFFYFSLFWSVNSRISLNIFIFHSKARALSCLPLDVLGGGGRLRRFKLPSGDNFHVVDLFKLRVHLMCLQVMISVVPDFCCFLL